LYRDRVNFLAVYVREAHPTDGWRMTSNDRAGITIKQPTTARERTAVATTCCSSLKVTMPMVVDEMDDRVGHAYSGMPDRLYLIDRDGRIAYKGGRGPFGFKVREMEQSLAMLLLDQHMTTTPVQPRTLPLKNADAWQRLPKAETGAGSPLPQWARTLADALPRTTALMLELDYLHRVRSPLDPKLRAEMRWLAAHANHCTYAEAYAAADLRRAGADEALLRTLAGEPAAWPEKDRAALAFARQLTLAADTVSDEQMAQLIKQYGEKQVVAMVLLLAYANFQDRLLLALGTSLEDGGPLAPLDVRFVRGGNAPAPAPRPAPRELPATPPQKPIGAEWTGLDFGSLQAHLEAQRERPPRIAVPTWDEVRRGLPKDYPATRPSRIKWSLVCLGYQPELSAAWLTCMRTFGEESKQDRVFEESVFWVITRSLHCFY
jgi:hypothetical protein